MRLFEVLLLLGLGLMFSSVFFPWVSVEVMEAGFSLSLGDLYAVAVSRDLSGFPEPFSSGLSLLFRRPRLVLPLAGLLLLFPASLLVGLLQFTRGSWETSSLGFGSALSGVLGFALWWVQVGDARGFFRQVGGGFGGLLASGLGFGMGPYVFLAGSVLVVLASLVGRILSG